MKNYQFQSYCAKCNDRKHIFNIGENESTTFDLISVKTVTFRRKKHRYEVVENLIVYFFIHIPFTRSMHRFGEKTENMRRGTLQRGVFPQKGGKHTLDGWELFRS